MAFDAFLKIDGIKGESTDAKHKDEIDLISFSWGEANTGNFGTGGGGGAGRTTFQDFHFTAHVNRSSPLLFFACASGQHIPSATLTCRKPSAQGVTSGAAAVPAAGPGEFLIFQMSDVLVSSYADGGNVADDRPTDSVSLNFAQLVIEYTRQNVDGVNAETVTRGWNVRTHKKV